MGSDAGSLGRICYRAVNGRIREDPGTGGCQGLYLPDGVLGGGNGDAHPACLGNVEVRKAFRLRPAAFGGAFISQCGVGRALGRAISHEKSNDINGSGGIVLFHDTKRQTAAMLPAFLRFLHHGGYRVVHVVAASP